MKIFLVTRGTQGDIYPYLEIVRALKARGHEILFSLPKEFEHLAQSFDVNYLTQKSDDITAMLDKVSGIKGLLAWMKRVIAEQFEEYIPLVQNCDLLIAANTEFAAPSIAELCGKPFVRTAYAPLLPSLKIPPPVMPFPKPNPIIRPKLLWKGLNFGLNSLMLSIINENRRKNGLAPIKDQGEYAPSYADNFLLYSPSMGNVDPDWRYKWHIGSYLFGDDIPYDVFEHKRFMEFVYKDQKPLVFFTMGSCKSKRRGFLSETLRKLCCDKGYKLAVGADWWKAGEVNGKDTDIFTLKSFVPHTWIFPHCTAIVHHGGSGTTHSAARSGRPQLILPLLLDQYYWGERVRTLGIGPAPVKVKTVTAHSFSKAISDLVENPVYVANAKTLGDKVRHETGIKTFIDYIEKTYGA
ncbi:MAG: glycosyltransferase [Spirochaetaceae bacterium]|jgi:UDP:flavonoid glycosyltransferase YjiC (YdhE family)|nr:glycosyltransferase [Spirochaetaceae bacterium]